MCIDQTEDVGHWFQFPSCPALANGRIVGSVDFDSQKGRGVGFNCTKTVDNSDGTKTDVVKVQVNGAFWPVRL